MNSEIKCHAKYHTLSFDHPMSDIERDDLKLLPERELRLSLNTLVNMSVYITKSTLYTMKSHWTSKQCKPGPGENDRKSLLLRKLAILFLVIL